MSTKEGINDYKQRSKTVEAHNGTFKRIYQYDYISIIGLKRVQNIMFTIVASYNLIRIFNLIKGNKMDLYSVISAIHSITNLKKEYLEKSNNFCQYSFHVSFNFVGI